MAIDKARQVPEPSALLLRRWLSETHTPVAMGRLEVGVADVRLRTDVRYWSPTGAHGFGAIQVVHNDGSVTAAEPEVLADVFSAEARARAPRDELINAPDAGAPADCLREIPDIFCGRQDRPGDAAKARQWLNTYVHSTVLTFARPGRGALVWAAVRRALAAIGSWGRRGVAEEAELLARLVDCLAEHGVTVPELAENTVGDLAYLNGSRVRYRSDSGGVCPRPVGYEVPNPLRDKAACDVPGVPLPRLAAGWSLRPVRLEDSADLVLVHRWMNSPHVAAGWKQDWPLPRWRAELAAQLGGDHSLPCVVGLDGRPVGYVELYRVVRDTLADCYPRHPRDLGVHVAIGEPDAVGRGLGSSLLSAVADGLFAAEPRCLRVVAEPDVHNGASIGAFRKAGFVQEREIGLPAKNAALMVRTGTTSPQDGLKST